MKDFRAGNLQLPQTNFDVFIFFGDVLGRCGGYLGAMFVRPLGRFLGHVRGDVDVERFLDSFR